MSNGRVKSDKEKKKRRAREQQSTARWFLGSVFQAVRRHGNRIITWVGTGYCVKQGALVLSAFAGRNTVASIAVQLFGQLSVVWSLSITISGLSISLYLVERRLHRKTRDRLTDRITELETRFDVRRTSSLLTPEGLTERRRVMQGSELVLTFEAMVCCVFIIWLLVRLWPEHRLDRFRQDVFCLRDELWDYAADGNISFDDPAYRLLRQLMNGFIRYAHHVSFFRVCMSFASHSAMKSTPLPVTWMGKWNKAVEELQDDGVRKNLCAFHGRLMARVARRLVFGSLPLFSLMLITLTMMMLNEGLERFHGYCRPYPQ